MGPYQIPSSIIFEKQNTVIAGILNSTETSINFIKLLKSSENEESLCIFLKLQIKKYERTTDLFLTHITAVIFPVYFSLKQKT